MMKKPSHYLATLLTVLMLSNPVSSQAAHQNGSHLSKTESQLVELVDNNLAESQALLEKVVNINSGTMNLPGVKKVGDIFAEELQQLGFASQWVEGAAFNRAGHLFAKRHSSQANAPKILMIGHLDTVFAKDSLIQKYIKVDEHFIKGPGIIDMKGGDVIIVYALKALKTMGLLDKLSIEVVMMGDEEKRGRPIATAAKVLIDSAKWADIALGYENGDNDPKTAIVSRRGYTGWTLNVTGKPAHSSQIFRDDIGYGAIYETARILDGFRTTLSTEPNLTFNPGRIVGGTTASSDSKSSTGQAFGKENVIAQITQVSGDLRALSPQQAEKAQLAMHKIVSNNLNKTDATITFEASYPPMAPSEGNYRLLGLFDQASQDLGFGPVKAVDPRRAGAADISFTAGHVDMAIDGLGLLGHSGHTDGETADMRTLPIQTKRSALLLYRLINR